MVLPAPALPAHSPVCEEALRARLQMRVIVGRLGASIESLSHLGWPVRKALPTSHFLTPIFVKIDSSPKAEEDLLAASCPRTPQPFYGGLRKARGPLAPGSLMGSPREFRPQQIPVSGRSALFAAWSRPPPVCRSEYGLGAGCLSGVSLPPLSQPPLLHCVRAWGLFRFVFGFSLELVFRPGGWEVREGPLQAPVPPTCSFLFREAQRARGTKPMYVFGPNMVRPALPVCVSCHPPRL